MTKSKILGFVMAASLLPFMASAATISNIKWDNGDVTTSGVGGSSKSATLRINVAPNEVVEQIQTDFLGDSLASNCIAVGGALGLQEGQNDVNVQMTLPPNTGSYTPEFRTYGVFGGAHQENCLSNQNGSQTFSAVTVTPNSSASTGSVSSVDALTALVASLKAQIDALMHPAAPAVPAACATLATKMAGAVYGVNTPGNVVLQGYLLGEGMSIPALAQGAAFGFYGSQTAAALAQYKALKGCN